VSYFTLRIIVILMETIKDLYCAMLSPAGAAPWVAQRAIVSPPRIVEKILQPPLLGVAAFENARLTRRWTPWLR
jgi:hypothetical protein